MIYTSASPIGVFDSGLGGISVLRQLHKQLPNEDFLYFGDSANAPYGTKTEAEIRALCLNVVKRFEERGIKALVIACNTASSAAGAMLREKLTIPVIAMEPALKPASMLTHGGKVLVLATPVTLRLAKFQRLMELYGKDALPMPCPGLMDLVEQGHITDDAPAAYLREVRKKLGDTQIDAVVLGCTHYVFLRAAAKSVFPEAEIVDGNAGTARQLARRLAECGLARTGGSGSVELATSGGEDMLAMMKQLFTMNTEDENNGF